LIDLRFRESHGRIPKEWEVVSLGEVSKVVRGASPRPAGSPQFFGGNFIPWITVAELTHSNSMYLRRTDELLTEAGSEQSRIIPEGTVILTNSGATLGVPKITTVRACANDGIAAFLALGARIDPQYLYFYLQSLTKWLRESVAPGMGQPNLNTEIISGLCMPLPPLPEQKKITEILSSVDNLIEKTERLIAKLKELKNAMLQELLTKGIGHTKFKDSPVGRIPEEWEVVRLGDCTASIDTGWSPVCASTPAVHGGWGSLKTTCVRWEGYFAKENKALPPDLSGLPELCVARNDILITRVGPSDRVGIAAHVPATPQRLMISENMFRVRLKDGSPLLPAFVPLSMQSENRQDYFSKRKVGMAGSQVVITQTFLQSLPLACPSKPEQERVVGAILQLQQTISGKQGLLEGFHSLKKALMGDLLTGRVRVKIKQ